MRACVVVVLISCLFLWYGLNAFPVCDCILYVPPLRCSFHACVMLFACLCGYVMACIVVCLCIDIIGLLCACSSVSFLSFVFGVHGLYVVCCVAGCCFIGLSCVYVLLLLLFCFRFCFVFVMV